MAKEIIIDLNVNASDSVQTLSKLETNLEELKQKIKGVGIGSSEFKKLSAEIRTTESQVKNLNKSFEGLDTDAIAGEMGKLAGGIGAAFGGIQLLAADADEDMQDLIKSVGGAIVAGNAIKGTIEAWTAAQKLLNVAMKANPIGLAIAGVAALAAGITYLISKYNEESGAVKENTAQLEKNNEERQKFEENIKNSINALEEEISKIEEANGSYSTLWNKLDEINLKRYESIAIIREQATENKKRLQEEIEDLSVFSENYADKRRELQDEIKKINKDTNKAIESENELSRIRIESALNSQLDRAQRTAKNLGDNVTNFLNDIKRQSGVILKDINNLELELFKESNKGRQDSIDFKTELLNKEFDVRAKTIKQELFLNIQQLRQKQRLIESEIKLESIKTTTLKNETDKRAESIQYELNLISEARKNNRLSRDLMEQESKLIFEKQILDQKSLDLGVTVNELNKQATEISAGANTELGNLAKTTNDYVKSLEDLKNVKISNLNVDKEKVASDKEVNKASLEDIIKTGKEINNRRVENEEYFQWVRAKLDLETNDKLFQGRLQNNLTMLEVEMGDTRTYTRKQSAMWDEYLKEKFEAGILSEQEYNNALETSKEQLYQEIEYIEEDYRQRKVKAEIDAYAEIADMALSIYSELNSAIMTNTMQRMDDELHFFNEQKDAEIERVNETNEEVQNSNAYTENEKLRYAEETQNELQILEDEKEAKDLEIRRKQAQYEKNNALFQIAIETLVASMKAAPNPVAIAATIALGTASAIAVNMRELPKYATGGLIEGDGNGTSDSNVVRVSNGESIINAQSTANFSGLLSAINQAGGGAAIGNANGKLKLDDETIMMIGAIINDKKVINVATDTTGVSNKVYNTQKRAKLF